MPEPPAPVLHHLRLRRAVVLIGVAIFVIAYGWLIITGHTSIRTSADAGAPTRSLWAAAIPPLAAVVVARLVPPSAPTQPPPADPQRRIRWQAAVLIIVALVFPVVSLLTARGLLYPLAKLILFLAVPLLAFRLLRGNAPPIRTIGGPRNWLAALPAAGVWLLLSELWPFAGPPPDQLPDPVTLAVGSVITLLTAGVLEEVFYRGWLQTRLETLAGRWPAILVSSLLFAVMHLDRVQADAVGVGLASIVAFQGMFGLMQGYLWSRYRNIWIIVAVHVVVNLVYLDLLRDLVLG